MGPMCPSCPTRIHCGPYRRLSDNDGGRSGRGKHFQMTILEKMGLQGKVTRLQARRHEITLKNTKIASIQAQERGQWKPTAVLGPGLPSWMR
uniref:uncharacterized protein LOC106675875 n=1 Tax=Maylandia zebra TaxID=106582 RepID=UPI000D3061AA|nr:uncharacterized protein LOC106675875 [Maylandia zebra]